MESFCFLVSTVHNISILCAFVCCGSRTFILHLHAVDSYLHLWSWLPIYCDQYLSKFLILCGLMRISHVWMAWDRCVELTWSHSVTPRNQSAKSRHKNWDNTRTRRTSDVLERQEPSRKLGNNFLCTRASDNREHLTSDRGVLRKCVFRFVLHVLHLLPTQRNLYCV